LINSAGYRIGPSEIENSILSIKDVEMVAVIGVPDDLRGEIVKAVVVPKNISNVKSQNNLLKEKIKSHVKNKLAAHEYPRIIQFVSELPLTTTGKIKRNILRQNHLKELK
jgi:acetyl-CoA synthetase